MSQYPVRAARADEYDAMQRCFGGALMFEFPADEKYKAAFEPDRSLVATDGDEVVGSTRVLTRDLSVPGAVVAAAHVTGVGVSATHRRRGILSSMMTEHLRAAPEALSVLWASEPGIYGRFGYGAAAWFVSYEIDLPRLKPRLADVPGRVRRLPAEGAAELLTSYVPEPGGPAGFYERLGFEPTGDVDGDGEVIMRLPLVPDAVAG